ncbi:hypothetical protein BDZ91DRAFT_800895 [Kalaharituber pfeilii]|nr:hypothetical protein BDZ91DRAFT_800895 [Kalaharituber pfeilii]
MSSVSRLRSVKHPQRNAHYSYDQLQEHREIDQAPAESANNNIKDLDSEYLMLELNLSSSKSSSTYPGLTIQTAISRTWPIILFNLLCEFLFAYTLKHYGAKRVLHSMERRVFNALVILLAAAISTGIGFLIDQVGYMLRGGLLMKGFNTKQEIAYVWQGTLGSYALLVWSHLRRKSYNVATTLALLFLIANVVGRLSVALFGFTYSLDFTDEIIVPALRVVQWPEADEPISGELDMHSKNASVARLIDDFWNNGMSILGSTLLEILRTAATGTITSLILPKANDTRLKDPAIDPHKMLNIPDLILSITGQGLDSTVSYTYQLKDEGGDELKKENRTIKTIAKCTQFNNSADLSEFPSTFYPIKANVKVQRLTTYTTMSTYTRRRTTVFHTVTTSKPSSKMVPVSENEDHSTNTVTNRITTDKASNTLRVSETEDHPADTLTNGIQTDNHAVTTPVTVTTQPEWDVLQSTDLRTDHAPNTIQVDVSEDHNADIVTNEISPEKDVTTTLVTVTRTDETDIFQDVTTVTTTLVTVTRTDLTDIFQSTPTENDVIVIPVTVTRTIKSDIPQSTKAPTQNDVITVPVTVTETGETDIVQETPTENDIIIIPVTVTSTIESDILQSTKAPTENDVITIPITVTETSETDIVQETTNIIIIPVTVTSTIESDILQSTKAPTENDVLTIPVTVTSTEEWDILQSTKVPTEIDVITMPVTVTSIEQWDVPQSTKVPTDVDTITTPVTVTSTEKWLVPQSTNLSTVVGRRDLETENVDGPIDHGEAPQLVGWMMFPYPPNTVDCGAACTNLALSAGNATIGVSEFNEYGVRYQCQVTVNYEATAPWTKSDRVAPSEGFRRTLSGFLVGNKTRRDMFKSDRQYFTYLQDRLWLPSWENGILEEPVPTVMIAGALARAVALVVRRMGDGLDRIEIMPPKTSVVAILSVQWQRVLIILGGIAGFQMLVAVLACWFVRAKLEVEYDVDLVSRTLKNENFQEEEEYGCPWQVVQMYKETPIYRFTGVIKKK